MHISVGKQFSFVFFFSFVTASFFLQYTSIDFHIVILFTNSCVERCVPYNDTFLVSLQVAFADTSLQVLPDMYI